MASVSGVADETVLTESAEAHDATLGAVTIAWLCHKNGVRPIPTPSSTEYEETTIAAVELDLTPAKSERIDDRDREDESFRG